MLPKSETVAVPFWCRSSTIVTAAAQVAAVAQVQSLDQELPHAAGMANKKQKPKQSLTDD